MLTEDDNHISRCPVTVTGPVSVNNNSKMKALPSPRWKRVILKISGMALSGGTQNVDPKVDFIVSNIAWHTMYPNVVSVLHMHFSGSDANC